MTRETWESRRVARLRAGARQDDDLAACRLLMAVAALSALIAGIVACNL